MSGDSQIVAEWLKSADHNADGARVILATTTWPLGACEHAQQAVEMSLKAALIHHLGHHPFIHDLSAIYRRLPKTVRESLEASIGVGGDDLKARFDRLTELWLDKYPRGAAKRGPPPATEEAEAAVALAERAVQWAHEECGMERVPIGPPSATTHEAPPSPSSTARGSPFA